MRIEEICGRYGVKLCYLFGSQQDKGKALLEGKEIEFVDPESDIDFAVLFHSPPGDSLDVYARLSLELQELAHPFRADILFLHEVDSLIQLEAIRGINVFCSDEASRDGYEDRVLARAADAYQVFKRNEKDLFEAIDLGYFEIEYKDG